MNGRKWGIAAIGLWVLTIAIFLVMFFKGNTQVTTDGRVAVNLTAPERAAILGEMRALLTAVQGIVDGAARNDMAHVTASARRVGMNAAVDTNPQILLKLPMDFKKTGMGVHQGFDDLASAAGKESSAQVLGRLAAQLAVCVGCHETYQLTSPAQ